MVPAASNITTPAAITVFALVHAIIFNAPLIRVKVEVEAVAPFASATAVMVLANVTGAGSTVLAEIASAMAAVVEFTPRLEK